MQRLLIVFMDRFPYGNSEPFYENEYPLYAGYFDKVLIVTGGRRKDNPTRILNPDKFEVLTDYTLSKDIYSILQSIPSLCCDRLFYSELKELIVHTGFSFKKLYDLCVVALCGNHRALIADNWLNKNPEYTANTIYSYWMNIPAYSAICLKKRLRDKQLRIVSRCHGYDVYSERYLTGYMPFQRQILERIDYLATASRDAKEYLDKKYGDDKKKHVHYLGASDNKELNPDAPRIPFHIVSCARVVPVKRLWKIVEALALIRDLDIYWTHIGDGELLEELKKKAGKELSANIKVDFVGGIANSRIYEMYKEHPFHLFLSVSESEGGAPVSICEAISYGIPVIATAVGGHPEIVVDGENGYLLDKDYDDTMLAELLRKVVHMEEVQYLSMRKAAREQFEKRFNSMNNGVKFIEEILLQE